MATCFRMNRQPISLPANKSSKLTHLTHNCHDEVDDTVLNSGCREITHMRKIALIEDDADLFALVKYNLEKEGFAFVGSQTGRGVVDLFRREKPDLILLDIMLPRFRRPGDLQSDSPAFGTGAYSGDLSDGACFRNGSYRRPGTGRQRLHCEALLRARTHCPHQRFNSAARSAPRAC